MIFTLSLSLRKNKNKKANDDEKHVYANSYFVIFSY